MTESGCGGRRNTVEDRDDPDNVVKAVGPERADTMGGKSVR